MNYYTLRYLIVVIAILIFIIVEFIGTRKNKKIRSKLILLSMIMGYLLYCILRIVPVEKAVIQFSSVQEAFTYSYSGNKIFKVFEGEDYAFVIYGPYDGNINCTYFIKENDKWRFNMPGTSTTKIRGSVNDYIIATNKIPGKNVTLIDVEYVDFYAQENADKVIEVEDSEKSIFEVIELNVAGNVKCYIKAVIIEDITQDYYLIINGNRISLP